MMLFVGITYFVMTLMMKVIHWLTINIFLLMTTLVATTGVVRSHCPLVDERHEDKAEGNLGFVKMKRKSELL